MRPHLSLVTTLLFLSWGFRVEADVLYSTTDLGRAYQTQFDGSRLVSVANEDHSLNYVFEKEPVQHIQEIIPGGPHAGDATVYTLSNATGKVGFKQWRFIGSGPAGDILFPTFGTWGGTWYTGLQSFENPVADMNILGQVVGRSDGFGAAFSGLNHQLHGDYLDPNADNLNNYINPIPGVTLTSALRIDDVGQIVSQGSDGKYYLLRPLELGPPQTVPEPTTLAILVGAGAVVGIRSLRRKSAAK